MDEDRDPGDQAGNGQDVPADDVEAKRQASRTASKWTKSGARNDPLHEGP
jgi:hypothetical protein